MIYFSSTAVTTQIWCGHPYIYHGRGASYPSCQYRMLGACAVVTNAGVGAAKSSGDTCPGGTNVCFSAEGRAGVKASTAVVVAAPEHHRGMPVPILNEVPLSTFVRPPRSSYEGEPDHPSTLLAASIWSYNDRRRKPHSVAAMGRFLMNVAIDTGAAWLVSRLVCRGFWLT